MSVFRWLVACALLSLAIGCGGGDKGKNKDLDVPKAPNAEGRK